MMTAANTVRPVAQFRPVVVSSVMRFSSHGKVGTTMTRDEGVGTAARRARNSLHAGTSGWSSSPFAGDDASWQGS
jgi:hypothetical protein